MVRLIDADAIPWDVEGVGEIPVITKEEIDEVPTVDAIPIEWLKEHYPTKQVYGTEQYFRTAYAVQDILAEWERTREEE